MYCHARCFDIWESERRAISGIATSEEPRGSPPQGSLLLRGGSLNRRSTELLERSRVILARSRGLIAKSDGRLEHLPIPAASRLTFSYAPDVRNSMPTE